jgi:hypothetical protein
VTMTFDEVWEMLPADGWLSRPEAECLWKWVNLAQGPILEVGVYMGRSTVLLACAGRVVYSVDPFDGFHSDLSGDQIRDRFVANLAHRKITNVFLFREKIEHYVPRRSGLGYLDGDHSYEGTRAQITKALGAGCKIICVHDVNDDGGGKHVKRACLEMLGPWKERVERLAVWEVEP